MVFAFNYDIPPLSWDILPGESIANTQDGYHPAYLMRGANNNHLLNHGLITASVLPAHPCEKWYTLG
jgi:hypothetical protein